MSAYIDVEVRFLPTVSGGRSAPVSLAGSGTIRYMPHLRVGPSGGELGVAFMEGPSITYPGETVRGTAVLLYEVDDSPLQPGAEFEVLEGPRCVGTGTVMRRWRSRAEWYLSRPPGRPATERAAEADTASG